jgi:hypothetical protein
VTTDEAYPDQAGERSDSESTSEQSGPSSELYLIIQVVLNGFVWDLNLFKISAEILASRLKGWGLLQRYNNTWLSAQSPE